MTYPTDLLNRPPILRPVSGDDYSTDDDWKGEAKIRAQNPRQEKVKRQYRGKSARSSGTRAQT